MMRTVLTAHAVLTGLYAPGADAAGLQIQVEKRTAMHCPLWCEPLAELMASGRAEARRDTGSAHFYAAVQQQATLSGAVRALTPPPPGIAAGSLPPARVTAIGVHDVPGFGLARLVFGQLGIRIARVNLHRQPFARVDQLHEQRGR